MALLIIPRPMKFIMHNFIELNSWRVFMLSCSIFPFLGLLSTLFLLEESPAFLLEAGMPEKSLKILRKIYSSNTGKPKDTFPVSKLFGVIENSSNSHDLFTGAPISSSKEWKETIDTI